MQKRAHHAGEPNRAVSNSLKFEIAGDAGNAAASLRDTKMKVACLILKLPMKTPLGLLLSFTLVLASLAQESTTVPLTAEGHRLSDDQLEQLLGPIALYPDTLIALILPAATAPADIVLASRYLKDGGDPNTVSSRAWDESVKSLVHYADLVKWMDDNLAWTKQVGEAFQDQAAEVMQAIQRLRAKARAAGTLQDSLQQQVLVDRDAIVIVPAQTGALYLPYYDPAIIYAPPPSLYGSTTFMTFGPPFATGPWLSFDCDWQRRTVWKDDQDRKGPDHRDWRHPVFPGQPGYVSDPNRHPWRPPRKFADGPIQNKDRPEAFAHPAPLANATHPTTAHNDAPQPGANSPERPRTESGRPASNLNHPFPPTPASTAAINSSPAMPILPPPDRRTQTTQAQNITNDRPNRVITFPNPPSSHTAINNPAPVAPSSPPPMIFPVAQPQLSRVGPAFSGPVAAPLPQSPPLAAAPAPVPPPTTPPAAPPGAPPASDKGNSKDSDPKKQLN